MYCPNCRSEFRAGITFCDNCEVDLVSEQPDADPFLDPAQMARFLADKELVQVVVGTYASVREAQNLLAKQKIASVVTGEDEEEQRAGMHARLYLLVDRNDLERVQAFFQDRWRRGVETEGLMFAPSATPVTEAGDEEGIPCPACGTSVPTTAAECPDCGLFLGDPAEA